MERQINSVSYLLTPYFSPTLWFCTLGWKWHRKGGGKRYDFLGKYLQAINARQPGDDQGEILTHFLTGFNEKNFKKSEIFKK